MPIGPFCYPPAMRITVVGAGYVGLVTGVCLARRGEHHVTLVETAPNRLRELEAGSMPIEEPGLAEAFAEARERITVVGSLDQVEDPDLVFLAVGTPISDTGEPDLSQLQSATADLRRLPDVDVSVRSTLPPGLSVRLPKLLGRANGARVSTNPEFLRQGSAVHDYEHPSRIIFGRFPETTDAHLAVVERVYAAIEAPRLHVDVAAAELIKNVANGFLALKLSFVNEVAALSEEYGVEVTEVLDGIGLDPRIGSVYMRPGLGLGVVPPQGAASPRGGGAPARPLHARRPGDQPGKCRTAGSVRPPILAEIPRDESRVGLLGLSFKADTDDLRGSPALHVARRLLRKGSS